VFLDGVAVALVVELGPEHDAAVLGRALDEWQHLRRELGGWHEPGARRALGGGQTQEDLARWHRLPPLPRGQERAAASAHLARLVVVELHPDEVEQPRVDRAAVPLVRERALRRRAQKHALAALFLTQVLEVPAAMSASW